MPVVIPIGDTDKSDLVFELDAIEIDGDESDTIASDSPM